MLKILPPPYQHVLCWNRGEKKTQQQCVRVSLQVHRLHVHHYLFITFHSAILQDRTDNLALPCCLWSCFTHINKLVLKSQTLRWGLGLGGMLQHIKWLEEWKMHPTLDFLKTGNQDHIFKNPWLAFLFYFNWQGAGLSMLKKTWLPGRLRVGDGSDKLLFLSSQLLRYFSG